MLSLHYVDNEINETRKQLSHMKYSYKGSVILKFYAYLCHVMDDFYLF
jgi:hypothetical protein